MEDDVALLNPIVRCFLVNLRCGGAAALGCEGLNITFRPIRVPLQGALKQSEPGVGSHKWESKPLKGLNAKSIIMNI